MRKRQDSRSRFSGQRRIGTIAFYGPDTTLATKVVTSVSGRNRFDEPVAMHVWTSQTGDVREDRTIAEAMAVFLREHGVTESMTTDRIIGCPHQEGVDYPMGRSCPRCPAWTGIDRFTHEPLVAPAPTMSAEDVLSALSEDLSVQLEDALASADVHRDALVEPLLSALERGIVNPLGAPDEDAHLFSYALYLLARWREPRALPYVVRWLSLPEEQPFAIAGDIVTQDGARILAAAYDGDLSPIKALILNRDADEYGRSAGVSALARLAAWAEVPRQPVVDHFLWLAREGLEREPSAVWDSLAADAADIEALEVFPALRRAFDEGLIDPQFMAPEELDEVEAEPRGRMLEETRDHHPPITDVLSATSWWNRRRDFGNREDTQSAFVEPQEPYRAPPKVGRNEPCPCGSGKKYKKCCGA